ncbi:E3 ubiquitin-protein ligase COP1 [Camellia lanceoleosa]|uniref:E3 ubiquitin-protein ligase COP1 n=1 Tax=Camellia lanceoleosa TaxID=1840588 RepID=A0ACC0GNF2_9ERIC|nr:E3 ubiquitin-protein ligase COP1 [Camellia lanceoleosa]
MGDSSMGVLVPSVKSEPMSSDAVAAPLPPPETTAEAAALELDKDFLCPICMQIIKDAFLTACGHSFCYMCIVTHLRNKSDCPCCGHYLTTNHLFPNFLLNKLLKETSARQMAKTSSPFKQLHHALQQGCDVSVKELDSLLTLLEEKKRKIEQEEAETNMQILLDFLHRLRKQKLEELNEIQTDLQYIKEDINAVERHRIDLYRAKERYSVKLRMLLDDPSAMKAWPSLMDRRRCGILSSIPPSPQGQCWMNEGNSQNRKVDGKALVSSQMVQRKDSYSGSDSHVTQSGLAVARKRRVHAQFNDLQECYLQRRRHWVRQSYKQEERDTNAMNREGYHAGLEDFQSVLSTFTRYSRLRVVAELRHGDLFHSANIVSSIEFDRDDELFATAGVSRRIKVFEFSSLVNESVDVQFPVVEMSTRSKLSCLSWSKCTKNHIASSDYEGIVTVWDVTTRQSVMEYEEHEKRAWSVDFSRTEPSMLVSGSDDCKVKIWCTNQEASVLDIDMKANICSVKYNPGSSFYVAVGSADHHVHYYDLRNVSQPLHVFSGHRKAVSYVKFLSSNELASASTDSTLRLWDVKENLPLRTFRGHTNEKNFVGLTVNSEYIACGSETNDVFVYHKAISRPAASHRFASSDLDDVDDDAGSYFISAVCWKSDSPTMLAANSQGTIKALVLAA